MRRPATSLSLRRLDRVRDAAVSHWLGLDGQRVEVRRARALAQALDGRQGRRVVARVARRAAAAPLALVPHDRNLLAALDLQKDSSRHSDSNQTAIT